MTIHLIKLCVGAESVADLEDWIAERLAEKRRLGEAAEQIHTTRQQPRRGAELLDGGSLYWVIKGAVLCRQRLLALRPVVSTDGVPRCELVLEPRVVPVVPRPARPFQGWRYLRAADAPADLPGESQPGMPEHLVRELATLGLL